MSPQAHVISRNKDAGIPGNGGEFAATTRSEPSLEDLRLVAVSAHDNYMRATEAELARNINEHFPDVATLEFDHIQHDESMPWLVGAKDDSGQNVSDEVLDEIRNEDLSGFADRNFGEWVSGDVVDLNVVGTSGSNHGK